MNGLEWPQTEEVTIGLDLKWFGAKVARFARRFAQNTKGDVVWTKMWLSSLGASRKTLYMSCNTIKLNSLQQPRRPRRPTS